MLTELSSTNTRKLCIKINGRITDLHDVYNTFRTQAIYTQILSNPRIYEGRGGPL